MRSTLLAVVLLVIPGAAYPQSDGAFLDPVARDLVGRATAARGEVGRSITGYTAVIKRRGAAVLRMPIRDRLLDREEAAARVWWSRGGPTTVHLLASRGQSGSDVEVEIGNGLGDVIFDPTSDRLYLGMSSLGSADEEDLWFAHPLAESSLPFYRYRSGDTLTVRPGTGRVIRAVELHVIPRTSSYHFFTATLWIEPETGAVVQAVYRPARAIDMERDTVGIDADDVDDLRYIPGFLKPIQADLESVVVEYALWDQRHWLPRLMRMEGHVRGGVLRLGFSQEISYQMESVREEGAPLSPDDAEREIAIATAGSELVRREMRTDGDSIVLFVPRDTSLLIRSDELPPPIWGDAPEFASDEELQALLARLENAVPRESLGGPLALRFQWGLGASDLARYNRVEGLSLGIRGVAAHPAAELRATARLGVADLVPNLELAAEIPRWGRTLTLAGYHQLASVDERGRALGMGNSIGALLFGRDNGEYYRATGARVSLAPPAAARPVFRLGAFAERQRAVERGTTWSAARVLDSGRALRPNLQADAVDLVGASFGWTPWWGLDPRRAQGGLDSFSEAATGTRTFSRSRLTARGILPAGTGHRLALEAAAGHAWGEVPAQYQWFLGGVETLRGYEASSLVGRSFLRGRAELARGTTYGALTLFGDAGWAGERAAFDADAMLFSAGVGASLLDGIIRLDLVRALRRPTGWRVEAYLNALI